VQGAAHANQLLSPLYQAQFHSAARFFGLVVLSRSGSGSARNQPWAIEAGSQPEFKSKSKSKSKSKPKKQPKLTANALKAGCVISFVTREPLSEIQRQNSHRQRTAIQSGRNSEFRLLMKTTSNT
jgi:hypothetical protein